MPWRRQATEEKQMKVTVEAILSAVMVRRHEYISHGRSKRGLEGGETDNEGYGKGREHRYAGRDTDDTHVGG